MEACLEGEGTMEGEGKAAWGIVKPVLLRAAVPAVRWWWRARRCRRWGRDGATESACDSYTGLGCGRLWVGFTFGISSLE